MHHSPGLKVTARWRCRSRAPAVGLTFSWMFGWVLWSALWLATGLMLGVPLVATADDPAHSPASRSGSPPGVPPALLPWVDWVLGDDDQRACPVDATGSPVCAWPGRLNLELDGDGGSFQQRWQVDAPGWVPLPGDGRSWPQQVLVAGEPVAVVARDGRPAVRLLAGDHQLEGRFIWPRRPDGLGLPPVLGSVALALDGVAVPNPRIDADGRLWLDPDRAPPTPPANAAPDSATLEVARRIDDGAPLQVQTRLALDIGGQPRPLQLGPVLLPGGIPLAIDSPLPAQLDRQGQLTVQVRPGRWTLTVTSHHPGPVDALKLVPGAPPWPAQEVWVFQADPALRQVDLRGADAIDPSQTRLPAAWQRLPAYLLAPGQTLELVPLQRGALDTDRLQMTRDLRLDFGGGGFSVRDRISGQLVDRDRLDAAPALQLGQVQVNGEPRLITRLPSPAAPVAAGTGDAAAGTAADDASADAGAGDGGLPDARLVGGAGVEVRRGPLDLVADARLTDLQTGLITRLPAVGWDVDFADITTRFYLPAGWDLLAVQGVDNLPASWLSRWSLLEIFLVLIVALAVGRLWGWPWGLLALAALVLTFNEPGAPRTIWLHVLASVALLRVLRPTGTPPPAGAARSGLESDPASGPQPLGLAGRQPGFNLLRTLVSWYYRGALIVLAVIALPFLVTEMRDGLFPQLDRAGISGTADARLLAPAPPLALESMADDERPEASAKGSYANGALARLRSPAGPAAEPAAAMAPLPTIDPGARIQTGAGVPNWEWRSVELRLSGPVAADQQLTLWLLPPWTALPLALLRVLLVILLALRLADLLRGERVRPAGASPPRRGLAATTASLSLWALPLLLPLAVVPGQVWAQDPAIDSSGAIANGNRVVPDALAAGFPPTDLLDELRKRLLAPPDCLPHCVEISLMRVEVDATDLRLGLVVNAAVPVALPVPGRWDGWRPAWIARDETPLDGLRRAPDGTLLLPIPAGRHGLLLRGPLPADGQLELPLPLRPRLVLAELVAPWVLDGVGPDGVPASQLRLSRPSQEPAAATDEDAAGAADAGPESAGADAGAETGADKGVSDGVVALPPLLRVTRTLRLGLDWTLLTEVERLSPAGVPVSLRVPLIDGEAVTSAGRQVSGGRMLVSLPPGQTRDGWAGTLTPVGELVLVASDDPRLTEVWRLEVSPLWHVTTAGIPPVQDLSTDAPPVAGGPGRLPTWRPWPGERLELAALRPLAVPGPTLTLDQSRYALTPGQRGTDASLSLVLRASQGSRHALRLPDGAELTRLTIDGQSRPLTLQQGTVDLPLVPGSQRVELGWREPTPIATRYRPAAVDLGTAGVNAEVVLRPAPSRWVLWAAGPAGQTSLGPAVQFWGLLAVLVLLALALSRVGITPLGFTDWFLLGVGLSQAGAWSAVLVALWLFALGLRRRLDPAIPRWRFNLLQVGLILLTLAALVALVAAVEQGLLGAPAMQIAGNDSGPGQLQWYLDRTGPVTPEVTLYSVPVWVYRALMLAWALWLAFRLLSWLRWGWQGFATPTPWREGSPKAAARDKDEPLSVDL